MTWALRAGLAALLALSVLWRVSAPGRPAPLADPRVRIAAALNGRAAGPIVDESTPHGLKIFRAPVAGCAAPVRVALTTRSFATVPVLMASASPGDRIWFAYLDWISPRPDRLALLKARLARSAQAALGLSPFVEPSTMLFLWEDRDCRAIEGGHWRRFWLAPAPFLSPGSEQLGRPAPVAR